MQEGISVVMCTYNGVAFLEQQLDSILNQTATVSELIIQDDCSTDGTWELIQRYAGRLPFIRATRNSRNVGFNENFRQAMMQAKEPYVAIADQDDIWYPQKLERQLQAIGTHDICFSAYHRDAVFSEHCRQKVCPQFNAERLLFSNCIPGHSMLVRREFLHQPAHWNPHVCYDWWFLMCAVFENGIVRVDEPLNWHRPHAASAIAQIHARYATRHTKATSPLMPYLYGGQDLKRLRNKEAWKIFNRMVQQRSSEVLRQDTPASSACSADHFTVRLLHQLSTCLLEGKTLRLCCLCFKYRKRIYPDVQVQGLMGGIRGFFYPFIYAYNNTNFEM